MTPRIRTVAVVLFILTLIIGAANLAATYLQVNSSQHKWCATLDLLTAHPVPRPADPSANPSREQGYVFYADFRDLRGELGCG